MDNLPPPPPALVVQLDPANTIRQMNGTPVYQTGTLNSRVVGGCWDDGAYPVGWSPSPLVPGLEGCARPNLRTAAGQQWQRLLDARPVNTPERLVVR